MKLDFEVMGLDGLEKKLLELETKVSYTGLRKAHTELMRPVRDDARRRANFDESNSGKHMRPSIGIRNRKPSSRSRGDYAIKTLVGPQKQHSQKAIAQEYGTAKQKAEPFLRPALRTNISKILRRYGAVLNRNLNEVSK